MVEQTSLTTLDATLTLEQLDSRKPDLWDRYVRFNRDKTANDDEQYCLETLLTVVNIFDFIIKNCKNKKKKYNMANEFQVLG
jgi:hypothetical protein